jgi:hypothetical protein
MSRTNKQEPENKEIGSCLAAVRDPDVLVFRDHPQILTREVVMILLFEFVLLPVLFGLSVYAILWGMRD